MAGGRGVLEPDINQKVLFFLILAGLGLMGLGGYLTNGDMAAKASGLALAVLGALVMVVAIAAFWLYTAGRVIGVWD